jgi:nucleotide-binding universal stress UspA family protein
MKALLVPLDLSDATESLLREAGRLACALEARLILLHVNEPVASYVPVGASMDILTAQPMEQGPDSATLEKRMEELSKKVGASVPSVESRVVVGLAVEEILSMAEEESVDYIVMASHGHGALYHLFSGSVVTGVLKHAKSPVVVIPSRKGNAE